MVRKDMRAALKGSMQQEEQAIHARFATAETVLAQMPKQTAAASESERQEKVIRDSFTMPASDYELIGRLKQRSMRAGIGTTKSEIMRAGLLALNEMTEADFTSVMERVERVKTGRPKRMS